MGIRINKEYRVHPYEEPAYEVLKLEDFWVRENGDGSAPEKWLVLSFERHSD